MEIQGLIGKPAIKAETSSQISRGDGASFLGTVAEAVKDGRITMPGGVETGKLDFNKNKFGIDEGLKVRESEEEQVKGFLNRIKRILEKKEK